MKKTKLGLTIVLASLLVSTGALSVLAAPGDGTTTGKVEFDVPGDTSTGEITKPDTPGEIIEVEDGNYTKGPLRLTHVPSFDFGTMEIASDTRFGNAIFSKYNVKDEATKADIAHFVQVEDLRGGEANKSDWKLSVAATKFKDGDAVLDNSAIVFTEAKTFNTRYDATELNNKIEVFTPNIDTVLPNDNSTFLLMSTVDGQTTNSTKTSLVFNNTYAAQKPIGDETEVAKGNAGVKLKAIGNDEKVKGKTYTATLTWTLADVK